MNKYYLSLLLTIIHCSIHTMFKPGEEVPNLAGRMPTTTTPQALQHVAEEEYDPNAAAAMPTQHTDLAAQNFDLDQASFDLPAQIQQYQQTIQAFQRQHIKIADDAISKNQEQIDTNQLAIDSTREQQNHEQSIRNVSKDLLANHNDKVIWHRGIRQEAAQKRKALQEQRKKLREGRQQIHAEIEKLQQQPQTPQIHQRIIALQLNEMDLQKQIHEGLLQHSALQQQIIDAQAQILAAEQDKLAIIKEHPTDSKKAEAVKPVKIQDDIVTSLTSDPEQNKKVIAGNKKHIQRYQQENIKPLDAQVKTNQEKIQQRQQFITDARGTQKTIKSKLSTEQQSAWQKIDKKVKTAKNQRFFLRDQRQIIDKERQQLAGQRQTIREQVQNLEAKITELKQKAEQSPVILQLQQKIIQLQAQEHALQQKIHMELLAQVPEKQKDIQEMQRRIRLLEELKLQVAGAGPPATGVPTVTKTAKAPTLVAKMPKSKL